MWKGLRRIGRKVERAGLRKNMRSKARQHKIATSLHSPSKGLRVIHRAEENSRSRTRKVKSDHRVFRKGTVASFQPCCVWELEDFFVSLSLLSHCFVILIKYSRAQKGTQASYPYHHPSLLL